MDHSANSGSLQSSSGDDDFDSPADSLAFFPASSSSTATSTPGANLPPPSSFSCHGYYHHQLLDSFSYLDSSSLLPFDPTTADADSWKSSLHSGRYSSNCTTDYTSLTTPSATSSPAVHPALPSSKAFAAITPRPMVQAPNQPAGAGPSSIEAPRRSSKKRTRASNRAPTTVLTTDTSNFRAMVQEFTGIPSPPFGSAGNTISSHPLGRSRFDFFQSGVSSAAAAFRSSSDPPMPPPPAYLLRPFAQKVQGPSIASNSVINPISSSSPPSATAASSGSSIAAATNIIQIGNVNTSIQMATSNDANPANNNSYQLASSDVGIGGQSQSLLNLQSSLFNFQSLPQPLLHQKNALLAMPQAPFNTRPQTMPSNSYASIALLGLPPELMGSSEGMQPSWSTDRVQPRSITGNYVGSQQRVTSSCKPNFSASDIPSEINSEKGSEAVAASRGEGMVEPWICPSD